MYKRKQYDLKLQRNCIATFCANDILDQQKYLRLYHATFFNNICIYIYVCINKKKSYSSWVFENSKLQLFTSMSNRKQMNK